MENKLLKKVIAKSEYERGKDFLKKVETSKPFRLHKLLIAASIVFIGVTFLYSIINKPSNSQQLFAEYFKPYENIISPKLRGNSENNDLVKAMLLYESNSNKEALSAINKLLIKKNKQLNIKNGIPRSYC